MAVGSTNASSKPEQPASSSSSSVPPPVHLDWQPKDYISALAKLETLQKQLCKVRLGPRHIAFSLAEPKDTPTSTFVEYQDASEQAIKDIDDLKTAWLDPDAEKIFLRCKELEHKHRLQSGTVGAVGLSEAELNSGVKIPLFGWVEQEKNIREQEKLQQADTSKDQIMDNVDSEDEQVILDSFKDRFTKLEWETSSKEVLLASLRCTGCMLNFRIRRELLSNSGSVYTAQVLGTGKEMREIATSVANRGRLSGLKHLLEYILSYKNWKLDKCDICNQLIDKSGSYPLGRREVRIPQQSELRLVSVHNHCISS